MDCTDLLNRIKSHLYLHSILPDEWFEDFDKLRLGRVSQAQFRRCFETIKFPLTESDFMILVETYGDGKGQINYREFCDEVETIFTNKDLTHNPTNQTINPKTLVSRDLKTNDNAQLESLLQRLAHQCHTKGIFIRDAYQDFDPHNCGHVSESQFLRALPFSDLSASDRSLLLQSYSDPILHDVNYKLLQIDVNRFHPQSITQTYLQEEKNERSFSHLTRSFQNSTNDALTRDNTSNFMASKSILPPKRGLLPHQLHSFKETIVEEPSDSCITKFAHFASQRRIRVREFFEAHDTLSVGKIPIEHFKGVLTTFGYSFTAAELDFISNKYLIVVDRTEYVKYREFCSEVEAITNSDPITETNRSVPQSNPKLKSILDKIKYTINRYRINILPTLSGFDQSKRGFITPSQFHRALSTLNIRITVDELTILTASYGSDVELDYFKFVEDVDPDHKQSRRDFQPLGTTKESVKSIYGRTPAGDKFVTADKADTMIANSKRGLISKVDEHKDIQSLLQDMKHWTLVNSVDFSDFLQPFDKLNLGEIPVHMFKSGMSMSGYRLTEDEFDSIVENYKSESRPDFVSYRKFAEDILSALAPLNLSKDPKETPLTPSETIQQTLNYQDLNVSTRNTENSTQKNNPIDLGIENHPANVKRILEIIARYVKMHRLPLMEQFRDKDKLNHRRITSTHFAQVIQLIGAHVSKSEIDTLCSFYMDHRTNFVDYPSFVKDINTMVGNIFVSRAQDTIVVNEIPKYSKEDSPYLVQQLSMANHVASWEEIKSKLQTYIFKRRIRLIDFFECFDHLHRGIIPYQKLRTVIGQVELPLTANEIQTIMETFFIPNEDFGTSDRTVITENSNFNYREFCKELNSIFYETELNRKPLDNGMAKDNALPDPSMTLQKLENQDESKVQMILQRMKKLVTTRRMNITEQFADYDKNPRKNYISKQQFKQCIGRLGLTTDSYEYDILCKKYRCTDLDDMNYLAFCKDIEGTY